MVPYVQFLAIGALRTFVVLAALASATVGMSEESSAAVEAKVSRLVSQLGDKDFAAREKAQEELAKLGFSAYDPLIAASNDRDLEIASRARYLLNLLRSRCLQQKDSPRIQELLENYDLKGPKERTQRIRVLVTLPDLSGIPIACRLLRFEKSDAVSDFIAAAILNWEPPDTASQARLAQIIKTNLIGCRRTGAKWLLAYVRLREDPKAALGDFAQLVAAERDRFERSPKESSPSVVAPLLYVLADAYARAGDIPQAEQTAARARQLAATKEDARLDVRLEVASGLKRRGRFTWAKQEYEQLISSGNNGAVFYGASELAEMLHDQGDDRGAASACRKAIESLDDKPIDWGDLADRVKQTRARMHYFTACDAEAKGEPRRQLDYLQRALRADPGEVDSLIASYHYPGQSPEVREKIVKQIRQEADKIRLEMAEEPESAEPCNKFAWLVGNTVGDLDEALRCAKVANEISPNTGSYLDTLAHVYFTRGDLKNAVKCQTQAAELEPYSGLIAAKLKFFREARDKKSGAKSG